ncbi:MAG: ATP synthase F1 subunit gamma [Clostridia bacterium]|nr:ATP synthase F1 subunit gamma [Clostridia bacterium]
MANTKEIKTRMNSVRDTQKITNAMYLIASTKLRKTKAEFDRARPYFRSLQGEIKRIFRTAKDVESRYFYPADGSPMPDGAYGCLVITADKGLAGAYNLNVIKKAQQLLAEHENTKLFVVGEYGRQFFMQHGIPIEQSFLYTAQNPTMQRAREISAVLLDRFDTGELTKIFIIFTDMKNSLNEEARVERLLPFHRKRFADTDAKERPVTTSFEFSPSIGEVLDTVIPSYVAGYIYGALVDSFCSEQNSRMTAMDAANRNAEKLLANLSVEYNRVRQAAITREITEVSAGAKAQRRKREREAAKG